MVGRLLAFVLGITFIVTGFLVDQPKNGEPRVAAQQVSSSEAPASSVQGQHDVAAPLTPVIVTPSESPASNLPTSNHVAAGPAARLSVSWHESTPELIQVVQAMSPQDQAILGFAVLSTGLDIYAVRVSIVIQEAFR